LVRSLFNVSREKLFESLARYVAGQRNKSAAAVELGRSGGEARAKVLTHEQRIHIAAMGGKAKGKVQ